VPRAGPADTVDLDPVRALVEEGAAGGDPGPALRAYGRLALRLAPESADLRDDFSRLASVAGACAGPLSGDGPLRLATRDALDEGDALLRVADAEVVAAASDLEEEGHRSRVLARAARARDLRVAAGERLFLGRDASAAALYRRSAVGFRGAAARAARLAAREIPDRAEWDLVLAGREGALLGVTGEAGPDPRLYAVGAGDADGPQFLVLHPGSRGWVRVPVAESGDLWWVTLVPGDGAWASGSGGRVVRYDPATGDLEDRSTGVDAILYGVWGTGPTDAWAVGGDPLGVGPRPALLHWDGEAWTPAEVPEAADGKILYKVFGAASDDAWAVGEAGLLLHWDGESWTEVPSGTASVLLTVHGVAVPTAVGGGASAVAIERGEGGAWTSLPVRGVSVGSGSQVPGPVKTLNGVHVPAAGAAVAVGNTASVVRRGPTGWDSVPGAPTGVRDLHAVWIDDAGNAVMVGGRLSDRKLGQIVTHGRRRLPSLVATRARFAETVAPLLYASCAHSGCHLPPFTSAGLALDTPQIIRDNLVGVPSTQAPLLRVAPGRPASSYLLHKIAGTHLAVGGSGVRMPEVHEPGDTFLTEAEEEAIRGWILDGARDD
jgi:hypothetical protein